MDVADIAIQERRADADLCLVEIVGLEAEAPEEGVDATLPAVGEGAGIPVEWVLFCHEIPMLAEAVHQGKKKAPDQRTDREQRTLEG